MSFLEKFQDMDRTHCPFPVNRYLGFRFRTNRSMCAAGNIPTNNWSIFHRVLLDSRNSIINLYVFFSESPPNRTDGDL